MKKILSLFLVCVLVFAIVPARTFAAEASGNEWVFSYTSHGYTEDTSLYTSSTTTMNFYLDSTVADVSDSWGFVNLGAGSAYTVYKNCISWAYNLLTVSAGEVPENPNPVPSADSSSAIVFELEPDTYGKLTPSLTYITHTASPIYEVYLVEKPSNASEISMNDGAAFGSKSKIAAFARNLDHSKRLGVFDAYGDGEVKTVSFPSVNVEEGKRYWLVFSPNGANENRVSQIGAASGNRTAYQATLKVASFSLKDSAVEAAPLYDYDISTNALSDSSVSYISTTIYKVNWKTDGLLNLAETDEYALAGRTGSDSSVTYNEKGYWQETKVSTGTANADVSTYTPLYKNESIATRPFFAIKINVPYGGKYKLSLVNNFELTDVLASYKKNDVAYGATAAVYFVKSDADLTHNTSKGTITDAAMLDSLIGESTFKGYYYSDKLAENGTPAVSSMGEVNIDAGEYYIVLDINEDSFPLQPLCWDRTNKGLQQQFIAISGIELTPVDDTDIDAVQSAYDAIVNINAENGTESASGITKAEVKAVAADINGNAVVEDAVIPSTEADVGSAYTAEAPQVDGYDFLYWARDIGANRKIVSHSAKYTFKVTSGGTLLTAVYKEKTDSLSKAVYYNGNGQILGSSTDTYTLPALPTMAGYETATHWELHGSDEIFEAGATGTVSGEMRFVAQYDNGLKNVTVTVTNGTGGGAVAYGSEVTVTAPERSGTDFFNYWENENGEILSFDKSYTFTALKNCTVKAVYKEYIPAAQTIRKIIITQSGNDIFAEFLGISDIVERGILFGENATIANYTAKVTMNTDANLFTVNNDIPGTPDAIGYAILSGGNIIYSK